MDDGKIFKIDTVPPPAGESDAYNAPTRVGSIEDWEAVMNAHESRLEPSPASPRVRGEPVPASQRARMPEPWPRASEIPPPPPLPGGVLPRLNAEDDDDDEARPSQLSWPAVGAAALTALEEVQRASMTSVPPAPRPSAFPEWVAGTNVQEKAAHEQAQRRKVRLLMQIGIVVTLVLAGLIAAVLRH